MNHWEIWNRAAGTIIPYIWKGRPGATGLSYYDRKGYHRKILQLSGKDGSLVVREE